MMTSRKLRERQAGMKARHKKVRPWDYVQDDEAGQFIVRMRMMFDRGYSDFFIAEALSLGVELVSILRTAKGCRSQSQPVVES